VVSPLLAVAALAIGLSAIHARRQVTIDRP
jgi:hypothetical protein